MQITYSKLETLTWAVFNDSSVNPVPADSYKVTPWPGGMTTQIVATKPYGGALAHVVLPLAQGTSQYTLAYAMSFPGIVPVEAQVLEFDLMASAPDGSVANMSCQLNIAAGWMWQITKAGGGWIDTMIKTPLATNTWNSISLQFAVNWSKKLTSAISLTANNTSYSIGSALQNVPFQPLAWGPNLVVVQRQLGVGGSGGAFGVDDTNINVTQQ